MHQGLADIDTAHHVMRCHTTQEKVQNASDDVASLRSGRQLATSKDAPCIARNKDSKHGG